MNYSLWSAGRTTHLKIVVVALACATAVVAIGINARLADMTTAEISTGGVVKAGQPISFAVQNGATIR